MIPENMSLVPIKVSIEGIRFIHYLKALERFCKTTHEFKEFSTL